MFDAKQMAEQATMTNFLNCYLRETGQGDWVSPPSAYRCAAMLHLPLVTQQISLYVRTQYRSATGRHLYEFPLLIERTPHQLQPLGIWACISLLVDELAHLQRSSPQNELLYRVMQSAHHLEMILQSHHDQQYPLYEPNPTFLEAEQSLLFGHPFHPTPKSRQGFPPWKEQIYSPETKGCYQLHYFAAHPDLVRQRSAWNKPASQIIREQIMPYSASHITDRWFHHVLIPVHPVQADWLKGEADVQEWLETGKLIDLGPMGAPYYATSSVRTVYRPDAAYMYKCSLRVEITNSLRVNKLSELDSAVEAAQLVSQIKPDVRRRYPRFHFICDGAYLTIGKEGTESGFELLIRDNPFVEQSGADTCGTIVAAALVQQSLGKSAMLLERIIAKAAQAKGCSKEQCSMEWFRTYVELTLQPLVWLYMEYGIALEAHLQNCILTHDEDGMPEQLYYRDNQGYYYAQSMTAKLDQLLPGIRTSSNVFSDELVEERFGYYLLVNHLFGLIQAFGISGLADERMLLLELGTAIEALIPHSRKETKLLQTWLFSPTLRCKANLLTRFHNVDELESELEQAVYVSIANPLCSERMVRPINEERRERPYDSNGIPSERIVESAQARITSTVGSVDI